MGVDKASLRIAGWEVPLAARLGAELAAVAEIVLEIGPGRSGLPVAEGREFGEGPLPAVALGAMALRSRGAGAALVVATDLPLVDRRLLSAIAGHRAPAEVSVVPVVDGRRQPLCARWSVTALVAAIEDAANGERRVVVPLERCPLVEATPAELGVGAEAFADVDEPADLARLGLVRMCDPASREAHRP